MLVSVKRTEGFLKRDEIQHSIATNFDKQNIDYNIAVDIYEASAKSLSKLKKVTLIHINFTDQRGSISAIIGQVGSAVLNELPLSSGTIQVREKMVYVSQESWIFASSIKQNILFGFPMDEKESWSIVSLGYTSSESLVFRNIIFLVMPEGKVGIVGRTGAGQCSLITALFRLGYLKGEIFMDCVATGHLVLHDV